MALKLTTRQILALVIVGLLIFGAGFLLGEYILFRWISRFAIDYFNLDITPNELMGEMFSRVQLHYGK